MSKYLKHYITMLVVMLMSRSCHQERDSIVTYAWPERAAVGDLLPAVPPQQGTGLVQADT